MIANPVNSGKPQTDNAVGNPERSPIQGNVQRLSHKGVELSGSKRRRPGKGLWFNGEVCKVCNSVEYQHHAKGICKHCYQKKWYKDNPSSRAQHDAKYYETHKEKFLANCKDYYIRKRDFIKSRVKDRYYSTSYDGNMLKALNRDNWECQNKNCSRRYSRLNVHPIDECGNKSPNPNHDLCNLVTLCVQCHALLHAGHDIV